MRPVSPSRVPAWLVALIGLLLAGVAPAAQQPDLRAGELQQLLARHKGEVLLLDVRTRGEWEQGRIPGSVLIPMNEVPARLSQIPASKKVVVVCATGARSGAVARFLAQRGYPWVANYAGGVFEWSRLGLPLER